MDININKIRPLLMLSKILDEIYQPNLWNCDHFGMILKNEYQKLE